ncbi:MAG: PEP-CTERM sorting domain-containing protein [Sedimentisphaeraceae bacterium JB056]
MCNIGKTSFLALFVLSCASLNAVMVEYNATSVSGNNWVYEYTVINNESFDIQSLSITFDTTEFTDLVISSSPDISAAWDEQLLNFTPGSEIYDVLAVGENKIGVGESLSGFSVSFTYNGSDSPGNQFFEIYDPEDYTEPLATGWTTPVPEPSTVLILAAGFFATRIKKR